MRSTRINGGHRGPDIIRIDSNCSEVERDGNFFKQDGKYYDLCCGFENEDVSECADLSWIAWLILGLFISLWSFFCFMPLFRKIFPCCVKHCPDKCYNTCCARCKPQSIVRNDNNATMNRAERSNISTISANIRQPSTSPPPSSTSPSSEIQEGFQRSKASEDQCN